MQYHRPCAQDGKPLKHGTVTRALRRHWRGLWLVLFFSVVTIITWTITCTLCYRSVNFATYYDRTGSYDKRSYEVNDWVRKVVKTAMSLLAAISIPVTSSICAKAAVVYCQKGPDNRRTSLSLRQTLALADRGWSDLRILSKLVRPGNGRRTGSLPLVVSALVCGLG